MSRGLRVVAPGLLTTIQDLGRTGYQHLGIPPSGALDPVGLRAANLLAGNPPATGALEVLYFGPTLAVEADEVRLAFAGAAATIEVLADARAPAGIRIEPMRSIRLKRGQAVRIGSLSGAAVLYVAAEGGFAIEPVLGSVSTYIRGGFGGLDGRALVQGDRLPLAGKPGPAQEDSRMSALSLKPPSRLRVLAGPQSDYFSERDMTSFFAGRYTVGAGSDRMGMRLEGPRVGHLRGFNITSDAIAPGSIQVPGDGQPIVLLADRQTTGGYPKIATVISADLPALGRLPIGARIAFDPVSVETAETARRELLAEIEGLAGRIVPMVESPALVTNRLFDSNLISGVADARSPAW